MASPPKERLLALLRQIQRRPGFLLVGPHRKTTQVAEKLLRDLGCTSNLAAPEAGNVWPEISRHLANVDLLLLLPGLRSDLVDSLTVVHQGSGKLQDIVSAATEQDVDERIREAVHAAIGALPPLESQLAPIKKDRRSKLPHHHSTIADAVIPKICAHPWVSKVIHRDGSGRPCAASVVGEGLAVHFDDKDGVTVICTSSHERHLQQLCDEVQAMIDDFTG